MRIENAHSWHNEYGEDLQVIEEELKRHVSERQLETGVWRAFASGEVRGRPEELYSHLNTNTGFSDDSILSFLKATDRFDHIVAYMDQTSALYQEREKEYMKKIDSVC